MPVTRPSELFAGSPFCDRLIRVTNAKRPGVICLPTSGVNGHDRPRDNPLAHSRPIQKRISHRACCFGGKCAPAIQGVAGTNTSCQRWAAAHRCAPSHLAPGISIGSGLSEMDRNKVASAVVSISTPGIWFGDAQTARTLARKCNEYSAQLVRDHAGRFGFFAAVPLPDMEGSLREIAYALDVLKADGIGLMTSYGDKWPGDPAYAPVLEELNRRKAVVYLHPTGPNCCRDLIPSIPYMFTEVLHDTTRAVTSLLFSGSFGRFREIRFIFSHAGGTLPMVAGRIARQSNNMKSLSEKLPNGVEYELRRLHYDIAGSANPPAMAALMKRVPTSQILFGSDYPWVRIDATAGGITNLGLSSADLQAIDRENAVALLPRLKE